MKGCEWADISTMSGTNSKLNYRQVHKIGMRFVEKYNLKPGKITSVCNWSASPVGKGLS